MSLKYCWIDFGIQKVKRQCKRLESIRVPSEHDVMLRLRLFFYYPRNAVHSAVFAVVRCLSVRPFVYLSVTRRYCD